MTQASPIAAAPSPARLTRMGRFEVRLAATPAERRAALRLRYEVFHREQGADAPSMDHARRVEADRFDPHCDHILVIDTEARAPGKGPAIVGTCRALCRPAPGIGWYAATEFDIAPLLARHARTRFCELGRFCIAPFYRRAQTLEAIWSSLWVYACRHGIEVFFGAASFPGTDASRHATALSYLRHAATAPVDWSAPALAPGALDMAILPPSALSAPVALRAMPPLVRFYLRVNAVFGPAAFIDPDFATTDVLVIARLAAAPPAYRQRLERATGLRHPALP